LGTLCCAFCAARYATAPNIPTQIRVTTAIRVRVHTLIEGKDSFGAPFLHPSPRKSDQRTSCSMRAAARSSAASSKRYGVAFGMVCSGPSRSSEPAAAFNA
jgi:hypothetical protein